VDVGDELLIVGMAAWTNLFGLISFELFGHLHNVVIDRDGYFAQVVDVLGQRVVPSTTESGTALGRRTSKKA
jgi:hypothetical protein